VGPVIQSPEFDQLDYGTDIFETGNVQSIRLLLTNGNVFRNLKDRGAMPRPVFDLADRTAGLLCRRRSGR
jgi:hypothetical protein